MTKQIEPETLREWLDAQQPVTVLDIRTDEDRSQWAVPGSVHLNAYEALRAGQPGALADTPLPTDRPIVTVYNVGRVSQTAADVLTARGFDARSLSGGLKAWSLAWNAADVPLPDTSVRVIQVLRHGWARWRSGYRDGWGRSPSLSIVSPRGCHPRRQILSALSI